MMFMRYLAVIGLTSMLACAATQRRGDYSCYDQDATTRPERTPEQQARDRAWLKRRKLMKRHEVTVDRIRNAFQREMLTLANHDWAGRYYYGDGLGCNVSITVSPKTGMTYKWIGCGGLYDIDYGPIVEVHRDYIDVKLSLPSIHQNYDAIKERFYRVRWADRHYLIPGEDMIQFCNAVNSGSEYGANTLNYLLRQRDREKPVFSLPDVPEQFRSYLLESPIECHITQIKSLPTASDDSKVLFCRIDAGRNAGLTTEMELYLSVEDSFEWQVDVEEILADSSRVRVSKWLNLPTDYFPQVGDLLSTRRYWNNRSRPMYDYSDPATRKFLLEYYGPSALEGYDE